MAELRCARCDRLRLDDELADIGKLVEKAGSLDQRPLASFVGRGGWGAFDDGDVCPTCQTPAEQEQLGRRVITRVEAEIARKRELDADPLPHEAALIAYAMALRERIKGPPPPESVAARPLVQDETSTQLRVVVTGAFLTGHPLRVRATAYRGLQQSLAAHLDRFGTGWSVDGEQWRPGGTYESGGGFSSMLPLVLARRDGPDLERDARTRLSGRPALERAWLEELTAGWELVPGPVRIDVYDLGMAVIDWTFAVRLPPSVTLDDAARTLKRAVWLKPDPQSQVESPISAACRELAHETTQQLTNATNSSSDQVRHQPWLSQPSADGTDLGPRDWGRLLWLHPVHVLDVSASEHNTLAAQLAPPFRRTIDIPGGVFVPGIGWSAVTTEPSAAGTEIALRLLLLHWAYIALYMEIDRGLLTVLDDDRWQSPEPLDVLEADADRIFDDYMRVVEARARLDTALASLGGDEFAIWETLSDVTKFEPLVDGVDRKIDVLQQVAERRVQQASASRARRTGEILSGLTALTLVTVAVALIGNFLGTRSDNLGHIEWRILIVAAALLASIGLYREAYRERAHQRATRRKRRG